MFVVFLKGFIDDLSSRIVQASHQVENKGSALDILRDLY